MRGLVAKALRQYSGFHPNTERRYDVLKRRKEVATPEGMRTVERLQVRISATSSKRPAYKRMKKIYKTLSPAQRSLLGFNNLPLAL